MGDNKVGAATRSRESKLGRRRGRGRDGMIRQSPPRTAAELSLLFVATSWSYRSGFEAEDGAMGGGLQAHGDRQKREPQVSTQTLRAAMTKWQVGMQRERGRKKKAIFKNAFPARTRDSVLGAAAAAEW